jgi:hypothetical protein
MSTVRIAWHRIHTGGGYVGRDRRGLILAPFVCVALFACCFAIGRAASPGSGPRAEAPPSLQVAFAGAAIPFRLSGAPPIQVQTVVRTSAPTHAGSHPAAAPSAGATAPAPTEAAPAPSEAASGAQDPVREASRAPAPVSPQPPAPTPAPASARGGGEGQSQPHTSAGTSFDSSG